MTMQNESTNQLTSLTSDQTDVTEKKESGGGNIDSFEDLLILIKPMGRWQIWTYIWIALLQYIFAMSNIAVAFYQIQPEAACVIPDTSEAYRHLPIRDQLNQSSPFTVVMGEIVYDHCHYYDQNYSSVGDAFGTSYAEPDHANTSLVECTEWVFNRTHDMEVTAVTQYSLLCGWKFGVELSQTVYMIGFLLGSLVAGYLSDRYGRRQTCAWSGVLGGVIGIMLGFAPNYYAFVLGRFLLPFAQMASTVSTFVLAIEITSSKWRVFVGGCFWMPDAFGYISGAGVAYLLPDWRIMHVAICAPALISFAYLWLLTESPRWLLNKGRIEAAEAVTRRAARINRAVIPENVDFYKIAKQINSQESASSAKTKSMALLLERQDGRFKHPKMLVMSINLSFNWFVNSMVYYGILLNVSSFAGSVFVNNAIGGLVEIPGYAITVPLLYWGRRNALALLLILAGLSLFVVPWIPENDLNWLRVSLAMFGKLCITASFAVVYVITGEIYPTEIRSSGLATSSCIARIGSAIAPYISSLQKFDPKLRWLTMVIFGVFAVAAGLLTLLLPETKGRHLTERIDDVTEIDDVTKPVPDA